MFPLFSKGVIQNWTKNIIGQKDVRSKDMEEVMLDKVISEEKLGHTLVGSWL